MNNNIQAVAKELSANDTGETGTHQAGILVPKHPDILGFFPDLGCSEKNPRTSISFVDEVGSTWKFNFIYYNNKFFSENGTRNEYRLTGMTAYFREKGLHAGDSIFLEKTESDYRICFERNRPSMVAEEPADYVGGKKRIVIGKGWHIIDY